MTTWVWRRRAGRVGSVAGLVLGLLAVLSAPPPSAAQDQALETYQPLFNHQPLALAYLAAPHAGSPAGRSSDFSLGASAPGASIMARFLPRPGLQPWEGIPFGLFKR